MAGLCEGGNEPLGSLKARKYLSHTGYRSQAADFYDTGIQKLIPGSETKPTDVQGLYCYSTLCGGQPISKQCSALRRTKACVRSRIPVPELLIGLEY
ncbi:hypothetical protein ANN_08368 [Periplaneta americana]|uniref:Uncharacterized protein n=1 Tax=Periplaneta americana TaxID=6978 RepID=A0ABQ8T181_PERAM|nr:hypothetical protein ANN_08368 [Periplaneta americana]